MHPVPATKLVLVDDHEIVRVGLRSFLSSLPTYTVIGEASTARASFPIIQSANPDVVVMDIALPGMDGVVATREILRRAPTIRVVVLSGHDQLSDVIDAIDAGAVGYALKGDPPETLVQALDHAGRGSVYLAPSVAARLSALKSLPPARDVLGVLSEREHEVFRLAADCRTSPEIAQQLCLARKTVDTHLNRINRKLGLHDRAQLVRLAANIGLLHSLRERS